MSDVSLTAIKLGFLGDSSVGKTAICNSFMGIEFAQEMISTIGSDKLETKMVLKNGKKVKVVLWDTAGQEMLVLGSKKLKIILVIAHLFYSETKQIYHKICGKLH